MDFKIFSLACFQNRSPWFSAVCLPKSKEPFRTLLSSWIMDDMAPSYAYLKLWLCFSVILIRAHYLTQLPVASSHNQWPLTVMARWAAMRKQTGSIFSKPFLGLSQHGNKASCPLSLWWRLLSSPFRRPGCPLEMPVLYLCAFSLSTALA